MLMLAQMAATPPPPSPKKKTVEEVVLSSMDDRHDISPEELRRRLRLRGGGPLANSVGGVAMLMALILAVIVLTVVSIVGLGITLHYGSEGCVVADPRIQVSWSTFLVVHGSVDVAAVGILILAVTCHTCCKARKDHEDQDDLNTFCGGLMGCVLIATLVFQFIWYIVGSVLYFHDVGGLDNICPTDTINYRFGLAWFIIDSVVWIALIVVKIY